MTSSIKPVNTSVTCKRSQDSLQFKSQIRFSKMLKLWKVLLVTSSKESVLKVKLNTLN